MPKNIIDNSIVLDEDDELDQQFAQEINAETQYTINEDLRIRNMVNTFTDIRAYLEHNALDTELFINIDQNLIEQMLSILSNS